MGNLSVYCKGCKGSVKIITSWFLFSNREFNNRIAILGQCRKCGQDVILLSEQRKVDGKVFNDLQVGKKARHILDLIINQIDFKIDNETNEIKTPSGWLYGKAVRNKNSYKILKSDFRGNTSVIGYIPDNTTKILTEEEYNEYINHTVNSN